MRARGKKNRYVLAVAIFFGIISMISFKRLFDVGAFVDLTEVSPNCQSITGLPGPEGIALSSTGLAFISSLDRQSIVYDNKWKQGAIYVLDLNQSGAKPQQITKDLGFELYPKGISIFEERNEETTVMVVNHRSDGYYIEQFLWQDQVLKHVKSITSNKLVFPSHVSSISPDRFYVSNEYGLYTLTGHMIEEIFSLKSSNVLYFDGTDFKVAAKNIHHAGGLFADPVGQRLYLSERNGKSLKIYKLDPDTGLLSQRESKDLDTYPNNVSLDQQKQLWIAAHPQMVDYASHRLDPKKVAAPSHIIRIKLKQKQDHVQSMLLTLNEGISASSAVVGYKDKFLIGASFEDKLLLCSSESVQISQKADHDHQ